MSGLRAQVRVLHLFRTLVKLNGVSVSCNNVYINDISHKNETFEQFFAKNITTIPWNADRLKMSDLISYAKSTYVLLTSVTLVPGTHYAMWYPVDILDKMIIKCEAIDNE